MSTSNEPPGREVALAIRDALPTRRHAEMLFEMVLDLAGEEAWVESWNDGAGRRLFLREAPGSPFLLPASILTVERGGRKGPSPLPTGIPGVFREPPKPPGRPPRLRGLGPGRIEIRDGVEYAAVAYGEDGRWFETSRSAIRGALVRAVPALDTGAASPPELLADLVAGLDPGREDPGRAYLPVPVPGGPVCVWTCGLFALRRTLFDEAAPIGPCVLVADGLTGRAVARGADREAALEAWRAEVARVRPFPAPSEPDEEPPPEPFIEEETTEDGFRVRMVLRGPTSDVPPIERIAENVPAAVLTVEGTPAAPPPVGEWVLLAGGTGRVYAAALLRDPDGFTLYGDRLLGAVDPFELEDRMAAADRDEPGGPLSPAEGTDTRVRTYRFVDAGTGDPFERPPTITSWTRGFHPESLDGDLLRGSVVRLRTGTW